MELTNGTGRAHQVRIELSTRENDLEIPANSVQMLVGAAWRRHQLSKLVNSLLSTASPIPFDFLINGERLRTSINEFLTRHSLSSENVLSVEYARAALPPSYQARFPHDDWIGAVDVLSDSCPAVTSMNGSNTQTISRGHERILTASYDGAVRVWDCSGQALATSAGALSPDRFGNRSLADGRLPQLRAAKFLSPTSLVAGGYRMYLRIWDYLEDENGVSGRLMPAMDLHGHNWIVNSLDVHHQSKQMLSTSNDHTAKLWSYNPAHKNAPSADPSLLPQLPTKSSDSQITSKRRKVSKSSDSGLGPEDVAPISRGSLTTLSASKNLSGSTDIASDGHTAPVNAAIFAPHDSTVAYTASSDDTLQTWDLTTSARVSTRTPMQWWQLFSLQGLPGVSNTGAVVAAGSRGKIFLVDLRDSQNTRSAVLKGHQSAVWSLDTDPARPWMLCSGSYDGCVRGWDLRMTGRVAGPGREASSVFRIPRETSRECDRLVGTVEGAEVGVLGVCWDREVGIVSGGKDRMLQFNK